jgi:hypothetical protein
MFVGAARSVENLLKELPSGAGIEARRRFAEHRELRLVPSTAQHLNVFQSCRLGIKCEKRRSIRRTG